MCLVYLSDKKNKEKDINLEPSPLVDSMMLCWIRLAAPRRSQEEQVKQDGSRLGAVLVTDVRAG